VRLLRFLRNSLRGHFGLQQTARDRGYHWGSKGQVGYQRSVYPLSTSRNEQIGATDSDWKSPRNHSFTDIIPQFVANTSAVRNS
jgi:hypothetical protein